MAHDYAYLDLSGTSLVSRVCDLDGALIYSEKQANRPENGQKTMKNVRKSAENASKRSRFSAREATLVEQINAFLGLGKESLEPPVLQAWSKRFRRFLVDLSRFSHVFTDFPRSSTLFHGVERCRSSVFLYGFRVISSDFMPATQVGALLCMLCIMLWCLCVYKELRRVWLAFEAALQIPRGRTCLEEHRFKAWELLYVLQGL